MADPTGSAEMDALAWGLFCRDLADAGRTYEEAVGYWYAEGSPARMDADRNGIPCETTYPTDAIIAVWGDPLPTDLAPGLVSGWSASARTAPVTPACCAENHNGPTSPPLPPVSGPWPDDGAYAVRVSRQEAETDLLELEIRRWLPCSAEPERCSSDPVEGDVYADPDLAVTRSILLDVTVIVVVRPIASFVDEQVVESPIEGDGAAFASLLGRIDAAMTRFAVPAYQSGDAFESELLEQGMSDPSFPYGPGPMGEGILAYRGPNGAFLTPGLYSVFDYEVPDWMFGWWCTLEVVDGVPILYVWAGQIAG